MKVIMVLALIWVWWSMAYSGRLFNALDATRGYDSQPDAFVPHASAFTTQTTTSVDPVIDYSNHPGLQRGTLALPNGESLSKECRNPSSLRSAMCAYTPAQLTTMYKNDLHLFLSYFRKWLYEANKHKWTIQQTYDVVRSDFHTHLKDVFRLDPARVATWFTPEFNEQMMMAGRYMLIDEFAHLFGKRASIDPCDTATDHGQAHHDFLALKDRIVQYFPAFFPAIWYPAELAYQLRLKQTQHMQLAAQQGNYLFVDQASTLTLDEYHQNQVWEINQN